MSTTPPSDESQDLPEVLSLLPLRNSVLFPGSITPIDVGRPKSVKLIEEATAVAQAEVNGAEVEGMFEFLHGPGATFIEDSLAEAGLEAEVPPFHHPAGGADT